MKYWIDEESGCRVCEPNCVEEWLEMIVDIGFDYDGCGNSLIDLRDLVDEMVECARKGLNCLDKNILREDDAIEYDAKRTPSFPPDEKIQAVLNKLAKDL